MTGTKKTKIAREMFARGVIRIGSAAPVKIGTWIFFCVTCWSYNTYSGSELLFLFPFPFVDFLPLFVLLAFYSILLLVLSHFTLHLWFVCWSSCLCCIAYARPVSKPFAIGAAMNLSGYVRNKAHVNIGTIGHVDHGKTTLTAAITKCKFFVQFFTFW